MIEYHSIDVVKSVIIAVLIGIPLSIYTSLLTSRLLSFNAAKTATITEFLHLPPRIVEAGNMRALNRVLALYGTASITALANDDQTRVAVELTRLVRGVMDEYRQSAVAAVPRELQLAEGVEWKDMSPQQWHNFMVQVLESNQIRDANHIKDLAKLQPDYRVIVFGPTAIRCWRGLRRKSGNS